MNTLSTRLVRLTDELEYRVRLWFRDKPVKGQQLLDELRAQSRDTLEPYVVLLERKLTDLTEGSEHDR